MTPLLYLALFLLPVLLGLFIIVYLFHKRNNHTELYSQALRQENNGSYQLALHDYEAALNEVRKLGLNDKFGQKIAERIKILRTTIEYENNFQTSHSQLS
jgi:hypothetical protein